MPFRPVGCVYTRGRGTSNASASKSDLSAGVSIIVIIGACCDDDALLSLGCVRVVGACFAIPSLTVKAMLKVSGCAGVQPGLMQVVGGVNMAVVWCCVGGFLDDVPSCCGLSV